MAITYNFTLGIDSYLKRIRLINQTEFLTDYGIDVAALGGSVSGTITGPDGVAIGTGLLIDLALGNNGDWFDLPLDQDGNILTGAYSFTTTFNLNATSVDITSVTADHTILLEGNGGLSNFFEAADSFTIPLGPNAGTYTIETATGAIDGDLTIVVTETVTTEGPPTGATIGFNITRTATTDEFLYSLCNKITPVVIVDFDCDSTQNGTIAFQDATVLPATHVLDSRLWSIAYPSNLSPAPAVNPVESSLSVVNFTELATGQWNYRIKQNVTVTQADGLVYTYTADSGAQPFDVICSGDLCDVSCCYQKIIAKFSQDVKTSGTSSLANLMIELGGLNNLLIDKKSCGNKTEFNAILQQMSDLIDASDVCSDDCGCGDGSGNTWIDNAGFSASTVIDAIIASIQFRLNTGVPTADDDINHGVQVGAVWKDVNTGILYECKDNAGGAATWKVYANESYILKVLLTQSGTSAPSVVILRNDFDDDPTPAFSATGLYTLTLTGMFPDTTSVLIANNYVPNLATIQAARIDSNTVIVKTFDQINAAANGILNNTYLIIEVPR